MITFRFKQMGEVLAERVRFVADRQVFIENKQVDNNKSTRAKVLLRFLRGWTGGEQESGSRAPL
jgi:hypothetical protein